MEYKNFTPQQRKWAARIVIGCVIVLIAIPLYKTRDKTVPIASKEKVVDLDKNTFEKGILAQTQADIRELNDSINDFKSEYLKKLSEISAENLKELQNHKNALDRSVQKAVDSRQNKTKDEIVREVIQKTGGEVRPKNQDSVFAKKAEAAERKGKVDTRKSQGIKVSKAENLQTKNNVKKGGGEEKNTVYMPPGFTEASLLSGVIASTSKRAGQTQVPMMIRVKNLAVLPNEFKQDIKGCFVIANGEGDLSQERVLARLATLSCISKDGQSIIDQPVKGWIVDHDGRAGMRGKVVAKFGAHTARVALAGAISGFGDVFSDTAYVTYSGAYGSSRELKDTDAGTLTQAGLGGSLSAVAKDLENFYLNLAEQTLPVIEVGPTKDITIAFSEGVELEIKKRI